jgi:hypothetical protein
MLGAPVQRSCRGSVRVRVGVAALAALERPGVVGKDLRKLLGFTTTEPTEITVGPAQRAASLAWNSAC